MITLIGTNIILVFVFAILSISTSNDNNDSVYAQNSSNATLKKTFYFQVEIPDDWIFRKFSNSYATGLLGFGPSNSLVAIPVEFWGSNTTYAVTQFRQDAYYDVKNASLNTYVKYKLAEQDAITVITQKDIILSNETSRQIYAEGIGKFDGFKFLEYYVFHNKEPYIITYHASNNVYEKYLPDFEKMVSSFKWIN